VLLNTHADETFLLPPIGIITKEKKVYFKYRLVP